MDKTILNYKFYIAFSDNESIKNKVNKTFVFRILNYYE